VERRWGSVGMGEEEGTGSAGRVGGGRVDGEVGRGIQGVCRGGSKGGECDRG